MPGRGSPPEDRMPFRLLTVADGPEPVRVTGGMTVVPDHAVEDAPPPRVMVVPARRSTERLLGWIRRTSATADLTMSVCTGAFALARAGSSRAGPPRPTTISWTAWPSSSPRCR